jgi:tryptophan-rich sensory protein
MGVVSNLLVLALRGACGWVVVAARSYDTVTEMIMLPFVQWVPT